MTQKAPPASSCLVNEKVPHTSSEKDVKSCARVESPQSTGRNASSARSRQESFLDSRRRESQSRLRGLARGSRGQGRLRGTAGQGRLHGMSGPGPHRTRSLITLDKRETPRRSINTRWHPTRSKIFDEILRRAWFCRSLQVMARSLSGVIPRYGRAPNNTQLIDLSCLLGGTAGPGLD